MIDRSNSLPIHEFPKKRWSVTASVVGSKFLGIFEADTKEEAEQKAEESDAASILLCHECSNECEDATIGSVEAEEVTWI